MKRKLTKENMIVLALSGVLLMVIALPTGGGRAEKTGKTESGTVLMDRESDMLEEEEETGEAAALERRLASFLSGLDGAGEVSVMLTFSSGQERVVEKDAASRQQQVSENDSAGGVRATLDQESEEGTVYETDGSGRQTPYVRKTLSARVEGVTVLAQGGDSPVVQKQITDMIQALFGVEAHKIRVAKLKQK